MSNEDKTLSYVAKNQLVYTSRKKLLKLYSDEESYYNFILMITSLLEEDQQFLASFPIAINNILEIINQGRFEFKTEGDVRKIENGIILTLNQIKQQATQEIKDDYKEKQEIMRMHPINSDTELAEVVASDILVIMELESDKPITIDKKEFLSSTAYFIEQFPELYLEHPEYIEKTLNYIRITDKKEPLYIRKGTKLVSKVLKKYNKISKSEKRE